MTRFAVFPLLALALACTEPTSSVFASKPIVIAHRGASWFAPEHTIAAYDRAVADGADYIEQDIHRTADGVLVVIHDATLDRTARGPASDCKGPVWEKTYAMMMSCDFGSWFNEANPERAVSGYSLLRIMTLEEVIQRYRGTVGFYIEMKIPERYPGIEAQLRDLLNAYGLLDSSPRPMVFVQSFNDQSLRVMRDLDKAVPIVRLVGTDIPPSFESFANFAIGVGVPAGMASAEFVREAHERCVAVHTFGGDSNLPGLLAAGVDGIFTDRPDLLRDLVDEENFTARLKNCPR